MSWKRFRRPRLLFVYPLAAAFFITAHISEASLRTGLLLIACGEGIRLWADGYVGHHKMTRQEGQLITAGPYAFVRNPLYLGTLLIGAGFCVTIGSAWLGAAAMGLFIATYWPKIAEEESLLLDEAGAGYRAYRSAVPRLVPFRWPYAGGQGRWSWQGIRASKEWKTVIWLIVFVILIYFWEESVQEHEWLFDERRMFRSILLGLVMLGAGVDIGMEVAKRRLKLAK